MSDPAPGTSQPNDRQSDADLELARVLLNGRHLPDPVAVRTAALIARMVVERQVALTLATRLPGAQEGSMRAQLLCLRSIQPRRGEDAAHLHGELSRACHHQPYELGPSIEEIAGLLERVRTLIGAPAAASSDR